MVSICKPLTWGALAIAPFLAISTIVSGGEPASPAAYVTPENPGLAVGDAAPDIELTNAAGDTVKLSEVWAKQPVVLTFYRGGWCPFCTKALAGWEKAVDELNAAGATFIAITPEKPEYIVKTTEKYELPFTVLSDASGDAQRAYKLQFTLDDKTIEKYKGYGIDLAVHNADGTWTLPAPATMVIDTTGTVRWIFADWDYKKRADPKEVLAAVKALGSSAN